MNFASLSNALLFVVLGISIFGLALVSITRILPGDLWNEALKKGNLSAAILLAGIALALGWIIAAAVH